MPTLQKITPCLWFDDQAEAAAALYTNIFKHSKINQISRYGEAGQDIHGRKPGSVMVVAFELDGHSFTALNGGPIFKFNEAISLQVNCDTQQEIDHFWDKLGADGDEKAQQCGWLKDKFGVSWQIVPSMMGIWMTDSDHQKTERLTAAMMQMKKLDIDELQRAFHGR